MTDLQVHEEAPREVVDPFTGELVTRTDLPAAVKLVRTIRDTEERFKAIKAWVTDAFTEKADSEAQWTYHIAGMTVSVDPPTATNLTWDTEELKKLKPLLGEERFRDLVHETIVYEPQTWKLKNAAKAGGEIAAIIERAQKRTPKTRYLKIV
jgi:hypothetical protein